MSAMSVGIVRLTQSSIGKKVIMAITGLIWIGFVAGHMYGNLKVFGGPVYFNEYAEGLRELGHPLFGRLHLLTVARVTLLAALALHFWAFISLTKQSQTARKTNYAKTKRLRTSSASLYMRYGGIYILFFIIFHLAHLTWGVPGVHPDFHHGDAYNNLVIGFQSYGYATTVIYFIALIALAMHLYHGMWSVFQTLGLNNKDYDQMIRMLAIGVAVVLPLGFAVVPLAVIFGILTV